MKKSFDEVIGSLRETISGYDFFTDFEKVFKNVKEIEVELNILNYLIGKVDNFDSEFCALITKYPNVLRAIPILLAVRNKKQNDSIKVFDNNEILEYNFIVKNKSNEEYLEFIKKTGLVKLFTEDKIKNLVDYVTGVEVGLDSNARKNRGGTTMEDLIKMNLIEIELRNSGMKVLSQATKSDIAREFNTNKLDNLVLVKETGGANKTFDFAVLSPTGKIYLIEVNFYSSGGSKLNETARSYTRLQEEINKLNGVEFVWITDGTGWKTARNNLHEAYQTITNLITLDTLKDDLKDILK